MEGIEHLKELVTRSLSQRGVLARLKAELRKEVFEAVREHNDDGVNDSSREGSKVRHASLGQAPSFLSTHRGSLSCWRRAR